VLNNKITGTVH